MKQTVTVRNHLYFNDQLNLQSVSKGPITAWFSAGLRILWVVLAVPVENFDFFSIDHATCDVSSERYIISTCRWCKAR